ncbi:hypothetical protein B1A99_05230 [Cohnella sp. CIP 111063]|uniref:hypothetical protein n=1 Tax=unclassified Cohnella TaxID=2636738 RepID=UPI000B8C62A5|nr:MULTISPECIES: hypothetical protein [unclassified Cohnella]OXS60936.1 hypothetical protein B1A99_05230 [Cohnella sp. CIP 111063]PRX73469.1 hypothetical protein B0G52_10366 [Cohnella sp. SGD-V74]
MLNYLKELNDIRQAEKEQLICDLELARAAREAAREHGKPRRKGAVWFRKLFGLEGGNRKRESDCCPHLECPLRSSPSSPRP